MFNKTHSISTKQRIALSKNKTPLGLYDINNNLIESFINQGR